MANIDPTSAAPPAPTARLSIAMIVRNEAGTLAQALTSVAGVADELVVVDTGSTDGTVDIAKQAGATVVHHPWADDFAEARNVALAHCSGDWVLVLDADEQLTPESLSALKQRLGPVTDPPVGYRVRIINWRDREHIEATEHLGARLFPRHPAIRFVGLIHERPQIDPESGTTLQWADAAEIVVHHDGYQRDNDGFAAKQARNLALLAKAVAEQPDDGYWHYHFGVALHTAGRLEEAADQYGAAIACCTAQGASPEYLPYCHIYVMSLFIADQRPAEAVALAMACRSLCEQEPDYWLNLAIAFTADGGHDAAIAAYERCLALADQARPPLVTDRGATTWKPLIGLGAAYLALGEKAQAEDYLRRALAVNPYHIDAIQTLIQLDLEGNDKRRTELDMRHLWQASKGDHRLHVYRELCRFLLHARRYGAAVDCFSRLAAEPASPFQQAILEELANAMGAAGLSAAIQAVLEPYRMVPGYYQILAKQYGNAGAYDALVVLCNDLLAAGIDLPFAHYYRGVAYLFTGNPVSAIADLQTVLAGRPYDLACRNHLGSAQLSSLQPDDAENSFSQVLTQDGENVTAQVGLIHVALLRRDTASALARLEALLQNAGDADRHEAVVALNGLKEHCETLFGHPMVWSGSHDPMALSRMIDLVSLCLRGLRERRTVVST